MRFKNSDFFKVSWTHAPMRLGSQEASFADDPSQPALEFDGDPGRGGG